MTTVLRDLSFALRSFRRRPGLAVVVVFTAGLAIGAATALFDLVNLVAWMPIPGTESGRLVRIHNEYPQPVIGLYGSIPTGDVATFREESTSFEGVASERWASIEMSPTGSARFATTAVEARFVSGNYFEVLGAKTGWGRPIRPSDDEPAAPAVAVLSHRFFSSQLGGDSNLLGEVVLLKDQPVTIVGVASPEFEMLVAGNKTDLWLADAVGSRFYQGYTNAPLVPDVDLLARLRRGVSVEQAQAELANLAKELDRTTPLPTIPRRITVIPARLSHAIDRRNFQPIVRMLTAAVVVLLVLACANIANMLLGRSLERGREISVRLAMGAGAGRLIRQVLTESVVLGLAAGGVGLGFALLGRRLFRLWDLQDFAALMKFDHRVLAASLLTCVATAVLFGLLPALTASRTNLVDTLKEGAGSVSRRTLRAFSWLAGLQMALATLLLVCTGAIATDLWSLKDADLGFDDEGLVRTSIFFGAIGYTKHEAQRFMIDLERKAQQLPMVETTTRSLFVPPVYLEIERTFKRPDDPENQRTSRLNVVDDGYFSTLGIPLIHGRAFDATEATGPPTAVVNQNFAREIWPEIPTDQVIGRTLLLEKRRPNDPEPEHRIVGVVGTIKQHDLRSNGESIIYLPIDQRPRPSLSLVARVKGDPKHYAEALRAEIEALDPRVQPGPIQDSEARMWDALVVQRLQSQSVAILAVIGVGLSLLGVFGVMRLSVERRRREVGIRMAVGATRSGVISNVLRQSALLTVCGALIGFAAAVWATRALATWVDGLEPTPIWVYLGAGLLLLVAALAASYLPARRAALIEPSQVLRSD